MKRQHTANTRRHCRYCDVEWRVTELPCFICRRYGHLGPLPSTPRSSFERIVETRALSRAMNPQMEAA